MRIQDGVCAYLALLTRKLWKCCSFMLSHNFFGFFFKLIKLIIHLEYICTFIVQKSNNPLIYQWNKSHCVWHTITSFDSFYPSCEIIEGLCAKKRRSYQICDNLNLFSESLQVKSRQDDSCFYLSCKCKVVQMFPSSLLVGWLLSPLEGSSAYRCTCNWFTLVAFCSSAPAL